MLFYIIRHGEPDYTTDTLTAEGWNQAHLAADRLAEANALLADALSEEA